MFDTIPTTYIYYSTGIFANQISSFELKPSHVSVSYDVVSLFKNISLNEAMDIVCKYVYKQHIYILHIYIYSSYIYILFIDVDYGVKLIA